MINEFTCYDNESVFRIEDNGRVRLILKPEDKVILIGQWNPKKGILLLQKGRQNFAKRSYALAIPKELWDGLKKIQTVCVNMRDTKRLFCADRSTVTMFGYDEDATQMTRQLYVFLDKEYWSEVDTMEDVIYFNEDRKAKYLSEKQ